MNEHTRSIASKVINTTANILAAPSKAVQGIRGTVSDIRRTSAKAQSNFANRKDNSNYYRGRSYWAKNKN